MCWRLHCPFKTRATPEERSTGDEITNILIFGITGLTGGALMEATLNCAWFRVSGFSRSKRGRVFDQLVAKGVTMFTGDMNKPQTLYAAMKNIDTVFLITAYWDSRSVDKEYSQGVNVINVAIEHDVKHLIYVGADYSLTQVGARCRYLEGKSMVENFIVSGGIPFTIIHLGFYFENFLSVFKPHCTAPRQFALAIPMGRVALNCGSVYDFGCCIGKMALEPTSYLFRTIKLATSYLTVAEIASKLDSHFQSLTFYDPQISLENYRALDVSEINELTTMFAHYRTLSQWDRTTTYELYPTWRSFDQWIADSAKDLVSVLHCKREKQVKRDRVTDFDSTESLREKIKMSKWSREGSAMYSHLLSRLRHVSLIGFAEKTETETEATTSKK